MKYLFLFIVAYFFIGIHIINAQCEISQTNMLTQFGWGIDHGQSFTACETGIIETIVFHTYTSEADGVASLSLYDSPMCNNLIWTVLNIQLNPNSEIIVDLSNGTGVNRSVEDSEKYFFNLSFEGNGNLVGSSGTDQYLGGSKLNGNCYESDNLDLYFKVVISPTSDIKHRKNDRIQIYPNPANTTLNFIGDDKGIHNISICNIQGELVYNSINKLNAINISGFDKGIYFVNIINKKENTIFKLLIN